MPTLDPKAIEDAIIGCSFPEGEQGMNMARAAMVLAGLPHSVGGVTVNRFCASGLTALQMAADRIRVGEADVMIAGGAESMSLVPMGGNKPSFNPEVFARDENVGIAYGMGLTAEKVAAQWKVSREAQDAFALASHQKALKAMAAGEFADEMTPIEVVERFPNLATGEVGTKTRTVNLDEGARPDTSLEGLAKLQARCSPPRAASPPATARQTSDGAGALILASEKADQAVRPEAAGALRQLRRARRAARDHGHRPHRGHPGRAALRRAERWPTSAGSSSTRPSPRRRWRSSTPWAWTRPRSTRWAAPSRWATRWAPPAPSAPPPWCTRCAATS